MGINGSSWAIDGEATITVRADGFVEHGSEFAALHHAILGKRSGLDMKFFRNLYGHSEYYVSDVMGLTS